VVTAAATDAAAATAAAAREGEAPEPPTPTSLLDALSFDLLRESRLRLRFGAASVFAFLLLLRRLLT
jgi:hypothetical protein